MNSDSLQGVWKADMSKWAELDPKVGALGRMAERMFGGTTVTFAGDQLTISGYGKGADKCFSFSERSADGGLVVLDVTRGAGGQGVYEIEFGDADHIVMRLTEPKQDVMALMR